MYKILYFRHLLQGTTFCTLQFVIYPEVVYKDANAAILIQTRAGVYKASSAWKTFFFSKMWIFSLFAQKNTFIVCRIIFCTFSFRWNRNCTSSKLKKYGWTKSWIIQPNIDFWLMWMQELNLFKKHKQLKLHRNVDLTFFGTCNHKYTYLRRIFCLFLCPYLEFSAHLHF